MRESFTVLARRYGPTLLAFCFSRVGDRERAEEMAQETMVRAFERLWSLRVPHAFGTWLFGIANYVMLQEHSSRSRSVPLEQAPERVSPGPVEKVGADESRKRILAEVDSLPPHYRIVLMQKYLEHLSCEEIATRLAISEGTVRSRLARAYRILRTALSDVEEEL